MANRKNTFILKRSNVPGKIPSSGDLLLGEIAINTADVILYASGTTTNSILPIGWDRVARTGDTMTGSLTVNGNVTVTGNVNTTLINATGGTSVFRSIEPLTDNTYVLGSTSKTWSNIHTREIRIYDSSGNDSIAITTPVLATSPDPAWNLVLPLLTGATFTLLGTYSGAGNTTNTAWFTISAGTNVTLTQSANISGGTIAISSQDTYVTGGTYNPSTGIATFINNTGGTFTVSGFNSSSAATASYITGFTYNNANTFTLTDNSGATLSATFNQVTGLTVNGNVTVTGTTSTSILTATTVTGLTTNVNELRFNTAYTGGTAGEGIMFWDEPNGTVTLGMYGGVVSQQIGLEQYYYVKNQSGATIQNGRAVRAAGTLGASGRILAEYMIADGSIEGRYTLGIATEDIVNGSDGYVTEFGLVRGIDTTGSLYGETWVDGDILYVSPTIAGGLTKNRPQAPDLNLEMAIVVNSHASNGSIFVRPHRYPNLSDLQNVTATGATAGDLIVFGTDNIWRNTKTLNGSYTITGSVTANTVSATTYYGDGSNLTGIVASWDGLQVITAGENVSAGDLLYLSADSKYYKVNNLLESKSSTELRIAVSAITANNTGSGLIQGEYTTTGLTAGAKYWVGSSGNFTSTLPSSEGSIVRYVGTALSTTVLEFNPDQTWLELATGTTAISTGTTYPAIRSITTSQTALANDETIICLSALTITLPTAVGIAGKTYYIKSRTTGTITIASTGGQLFDDDASITITTKNESYTLQSDGANWIIK